MNHQLALRSQAVERYTLGELSSPEREEFEEHFFGCPECTGALQEYELFIANTRAVLKEDSLLAKQPAAIATQTVQSGWWPGARKWFAIPAVAFAGLALAFVMLRAPGPGAPDPSGPQVEWALMADTRAGAVPHVSLPANAVWAELELKLQALEPDRWASYHWEIRRVEDSKLIEQGDGHGAGVLKARIAASRFELLKTYKLSVQGDPATAPLGSSFVVDRN